MLSPAERTTTGDGLPESARPETGSNARGWRSTTPMRVVTPDVSVWSRLGGLWTHRELLMRLIRKELKVKYKDSVLGFLWSMLNPALYLLVFYFVFQIVLRNTIPQFAIFLLSGLLVWNLFSTAVPGATTAVVGNSGIVKKVAFPREMLALSSVGAALVFFFLQAVVLIIALLAFNLRPALHYLPLLIPALITLLVFSGALAVFLSAVNVYLRDTQHLLELVLVAWFWATPIVYPYRLIADRLAQHGLSWLLLLNPITPVVITFQRAIYARPEPIGTDGKVVHALPLAGPWWYLEVLAIVFAVSTVLFVIALSIFGRLEGNFAEEL